MAKTSPLVVYRRKNKMTQADMAARLKVKPPAISKWESGKVSVGMVLAVEKLTGIPRHKLRPDIYPAPEREKA
jgi:transcriptional regulator with XRE-family HTH domain